MATAKSKSSSKIKRKTVNDLTEKDLSFIRKITSEKKGTWTVPLLTVALACGMHVCRLRPPSHDGRDRPPRTHQAFGKSGQGRGGRSRIEEQNTQTTALIFCVGKIAIGFNTASEFWVSIASEKSPVPSRRP